MSPQFSQRVLVAGKAPVPVIQKGWWAGGFNGFVVRTGFQGIDYVSETSINPAALLSVFRSDLAGNSSGVKGYCGGGSVATSFDVPVDAIDGMIFETLAAFNPAAGLAGGARRELGGVSSFQTQKGYWGGGNFSFVARSNTIDGIRYDTDLTVNPTATLASARAVLAGGVNSGTHGYFAGGFTSVASTEIDGIRFDTETSFNPTAILNKINVGPGGVCSEVKGYWAGGSNTFNNPGTVYYNSYSGIAFATDLAFSPSLVLSRVKRQLTGVSGKLKGYFGGGFNGISPFWYTDIDGLVFATDTSENPAASLPEGNAAEMGGIQQWPQN